MKNLYERVLEQTKKRNITGKELGEMLGLKKSPLTDWKNGKSNPTLEQFNKICEIFAISPNWLLTGKESGTFTPDEEKLIELYKNTNQTGKQLIIAAAESAHKLMPQEQQSSTSKIG